ncbi:MAG: sulfite exporter TauE/SafE family protein [Pseudomonas marincola]
MLETLTDFTNLSTDEFLICSAAMLLAGLVRGFAGFALSAILMASIVYILPPIELIPLCYFLEAAASISMLRGGIKDAKMSMVWALAICSAIGVPIGLYATISIPTETSKIVALVIVMILTLAQLFKFSPKFLRTKGGLYGSGITAGIATGLASVGGMVVALFVLSSKTDARTMRASLVMFMFLGMFTSLVYMLLYGVMNYQAFQRAIVFIPIVLVGVFFGSFLFRPSLVIYYKQFCLFLLIALSFAGLVRLI